MVCPKLPRTIRRIVPGRPTPRNGIVRATMRTLVVALVLAIVSLAGAQVWVAPRQGVGGRDVPGTLQNPYIVYDHGFPTAQLNTPQVNPPPNQPLLVTPLGRPLGTDFGDRSVAAACSAKGASEGAMKLPRTPARTSTVVAVYTGLMVVALALSAADSRWHLSA